MIYCKHCKKEIEPVFKHHNWKCPICNKFIAMSEKREKPQVLESRPVKGMDNTKIIKLNRENFELGELIIKSGMAKDFSDLVKKSISLLGRSILLDTQNKVLDGHSILPDTQNKVLESNREPNPERTMKQIQEKELMKTYIDMIKNSNSNNNKFDPLSAMMMMRMMNKNKDEGRITITIK